LPKAEARQKVFDELKARQEALREQLAKAGETTPLARIRGDRERALRDAGKWEREKGLRPGQLGGDIGKLYAYKEQQVAQQQAKREHEQAERRKADLRSIREELDRMRGAAKVDVLDAMGLGDAARLAAVDNGLKRYKTNLDRMWADLGKKGPRTAEDSATFEALWKGAQATAEARRKGIKGGAAKSVRMERMGIEQYLSSIQAVAGQKQDDHAVLRDQLRAMLENGATLEKILERIKEEGGGAPLVGAARA